MHPAEVPFERFAQFRRYMSLGLLPGGDLLYTTDLTGQFNLWRQPIGPGGAPGYPRLLTAFTDRPVRDFRATTDGRSVLYTADQNGDENYQIYRLWLDQGFTESITEAPTVQHELGGGSVLTPKGELIYTDNGREAQDVDVVVKNLRTGATSRPFPPGFVWTAPRFDPTARRILALQFITNSDVRTFVLDRKRGSTSEVLPHSGEALVVPIDWTRDGKGVFLVTDLESEFRRLLLFDVESGTSTVLASPKADVEEVAYSARSGTLAYVVNQGGYSVVFAGRPGRRFTRVETPKGAIPPGIWGSQFEISDDGRFAVALWGTGRAPPEILRIPLRGGASRYVTDGVVGGVPDAPRPPPRLVTVTGPEGRSVPAWYYLPKRRPNGPMAAVLSIHGGPNAQERPDWRYSGMHAFLNSRGIAVLTPNIRGSTGYGKSYELLLQRDWGGQEVEDLRACAEWLRMRPEIDGSRLGVFGASYGGFATLCCLTRLPEYWKVGVDVFGPSNLVTFLTSIPPSWRKGMAKMVGDPERDRDALLARSPITHLDKVRADMLVVQGAKDPRVVKAESDQLVEKLRAAGRQVEYIVFDDEGHGFMRQANQVRAYSRISSFLVEHLSPPA